MSNLKTINRIFKYSTAVLSAALFFLSYFPAAASNTDEIIIVEKIEQNSNEISIAGGPELSSVETEFYTLAEKLTGSVTFDIESAERDSTETSVKRARIMVKDTQNVRVETNLPNGMEMIITSVKDDGWIFFPKTNMIMELKRNLKHGSKITDGNFINRFLTDRQSHIINKTSLAQGDYCFEIARKDGNKVVSYFFSKENIPQKITVIEKNKDSEEILIKNTIFGPIDDSYFIRPKNAFKMPVNEFPDFDY